MSKKVLIITYYWPPSGGGGVQRWLKFVKYLPEYGWEPIVFTPENPDFELQDDGLLADVPKGIQVIKQPIWEPFALYRKLMGKKAVQKQGVVSQTGGSLVGRLIRWIRGNAFVPDARVFWVRPASKYLINYLKENPVDVIATTGPPHSMHLIGQRVKRKTGIPWVADFRDPWSEWDVLPQLSLNKRSWERHKQMEFGVLNLADKVVTVSNRLGEALDRIAGVPVTEVVNNGYDGADFDEFESQVPDKFRLVHMGLLNEGRNPVKLWKVLDKLCEREPDFADELEVVLAGTIEQSVKNHVAEYKHLASRVKILDYIPHEEAITVNRSAALLLVLLNQTSNSPWILPGKMYEYLPIHRPILSFGPLESDANDLLKGCGYAGFLRYNDVKGIQALVLNYFRAYQEGNTKEGNASVEQFTRKNLTAKLSGILENVVLD